MYRVLWLLRKYRLKALFFITGHLAEKLSNFPEILDLLRDHQIGFHSSSHSVRPIIFEYADAEKYEEAYSRSIKRETAHINFLTGEVEGKGGIEFLRHLFPEKNVVSFRAPGFSWSPPHLEALVKLGIKFDFSADISPWTVYFKGVTFYPYPIFVETMLFNLSAYLQFLNSILRKNITVLASHINSFTNRTWWDSIYYKGNPEKLFKAQPKTKKETESMLLRLEIFLLQIKLFQSLKLIEVTPYLRKSRINLTVPEIDVQKIYEKSLSWAQNFFDYKPKFQRSHFFNYFMSV